MTEVKCERISRFAFEFAREKGRKKVTAIHKANIMKKGDGLFLRVSREVAKDYPDIEFSDMIVDNTCMQLVSNPNQFDVMLLPNLYGNIGLGFFWNMGLVVNNIVANMANSRTLMHIYVPTHARNIISPHRRQRLLRPHRRPRPLRRLQLLLQLPRRPQHRRPVRNGH